MTFYLIRIPLLVFFPLIWLAGYLVEKPRLTKFGKVGTIVTAALAGLIIFYFMIFVKGKSSKT